MTHVRAVPVSIVLLALISSAMLAQSGHDLFQQALVQERTYGNLEQAIELYERIVSNFPDDRPLVASALVQLGSAYEMMGGAGARTAYRRVVREFADQSEEARVARARLSALPTSGGPTYTFAFDGLRVDEPGQPAPYDLSPDGRRLVFIDRRPGVPGPGLYVWDGEGGDVRPAVTADAVSGPIERLLNPRWSPDGERIAFIARFPERDRLMGLYVFDLDKGALERVDDTFGSDLCWTPDGSS